MFCINNKKKISEYNITVLEITIVNDPKNNQYFWINRRDLEIETKCN